MAYLQSEETPSSIKKAYETLVTEFGKKVVGGGNRERIIKSLALNRVSLEVFSHWLVKLNELEKWPELGLQLKSLLASQWDQLVLIGQAQAHAAKAIIPGNSFLKGLAEAMASHRCRIARIDMPVIHGVDDGRLTIVGYEPDQSKSGSKGLLYLIPGTAIAVAKDQLARAGGSLDFSQKAISTSLDRAGHFMEKDGGRNTKKIRVKGDLMDLWVIPRTALFPEDPDVPVLENEDDPLVLS